ncbi:MAG: ABC transporter ATP-binding protein, partial [Anaerolineae bacterium]|nr:ABC transporter ATP-binding protein [Anaerolineae bacterium]
MSVHLDDLHFSYPLISAGAPAVEVLHGVTLDVPAGQSLAIMGPTSSGKSTLALVLAGLAPSMTGGVLTGQVQVNGQDAAATPAAVLSASLGIVFQEPERQLFNMTVAEEVAFSLEGLALPPQEIGERVELALAQVGLTGLEERSPWQLSGGQQKRLAIATLLAIRPPILLLDEPMAGLDPAARREVAAVLADLRRTAAATVIVLEKDAEFVARWAERVVILAAGQVVLDGTP